VTDASRDTDGVLRLAMRPPQTLNPLLNRDVSVARVLGLMFEPLAVLDEYLRPVGNLAQLEMSMDFSSVYVTIHSHALWSNGFPVTADDLIFSVKTLRNAPADAIYARVISNISGITRTSERTALINFYNASPLVGYSLLFPLIPRHYFLHETNPASARNMAPVGNGSFIFESLIPFELLNLAQNPHALRGTPRIMRVEISLIAEAELELYAFERGLIDAIVMAVPEWARIPSARDVSAHVFNTMYFEFVGFNMGREQWHDAQVRRGVAHAFDADEIIETLYLHHAVRAFSPIHPLSWKKSGEVTGVAHDRDNAHLFLYELERDEPLVIISGTNSERVAIAQRLAEGLRDLDFYVIVYSLDDEDFRTRRARGDYDFFVGWAQLCRSFDFTFLFPYDAPLQIHFNAMSTAASDAAFASAVLAFETAFAERVSVIGLAFRHSAIITGTRVVNNAPVSPTSVFLHANYWEIFL
jgi:ABC-type transport system substrate-binding protein